MEKEKTFSGDVSIVLGGAAGQGLQTIERVLSSVLNQEGYRVFSISEYMSRVRGGDNSTQIRVTNKRREAYVERMDLFFPLHKGSIEHCEKRIDENTCIIADAEQLGESLGKHQVSTVPFLKEAESIGGKIYMNTLVAGCILSFFDIKDGVVEEFIKKAFSKKGDEIVENNLKAIAKGKELGTQIKEEQKIQIQIEKHPEKENDLFMTGTDAVALGAVSGGCDFISSYPMTPATGVINGIAAASKHFDIVVEQVEDEISAVNMALGAWYSGARAIVSTSGGGFALMTEAVSLAGIMESPMVFHLAQRPGPATGYPTRTEQGDLKFVLHAGHGEFPRVIYAPGTIEDGYMLAKKAFDVADKYQVPVFILTDQFYVDAHMCANSEKMPVEDVQKYFIETGEKYKRYAYTDNGLSPRGLPGHGEGFVCADSDEHEEEGRITESHDTRVKMMNKRMGRMELLKEDAVPAERIGAENCSILVIGWGSTYGAIKESLENIDKEQVAFMHAKQVFPLPENLVQAVHAADKVIVVENNYSGQFADLVHLNTDRKPDHRVVQFDGMPFSVERLTEELDALTN